MAEFCVDCWKRMNRETDQEDKYVLSDEPDLCEGCGAWKPVVVRLRIGYRLRQWLKAIKEK